MDLGRQSNTTEARLLIVMVQYYRDMCPRGSHVLAPLTVAASDPKVRKILWNDALESFFKEMKRIVSAKNLLSYTDRKLPFTVYTDAHDKQLDVVIRQDNKPIDLLSRKYIKTQRNYNTTEKELLTILECLKQFRGILFSYKINVFL